MNSQLVMQAKGLTKRYGQVTALDGSDFELRQGEILAVIGDNGAGKSSLIKCLSGATIPDGLLGSQRARECLTTKNASTCAGSVNAQVTEPPPISEPLSTQS